MPRKAQGTQKPAECTLDEQRKRELAESGFASARQAKEYLGVSLSRVYGLRRAKVLSSAVIGGRIVFPWASLKAYAASRIVLGTIDKPNRLK